MLSNWFVSCYHLCNLHILLWPCLHHDGSIKVIPCTKKTKKKRFELCDALAHIKLIEPPIGAQQVSNLTHLSTPYPSPFHFWVKPSQQHIVTIIIHKKTIWGHSLPWSHHHPINQTNKSKHKTKKREKGNKAFYKHKEMKKNWPWILDSFVVTCHIHYTPWKWISLSILPQIEFVTNHIVSLWLLCYMSKTLVQSISQNMHIHEKLTCKELIYHCTRIWKYNCN